MEDDFNFIEKGRQPNFFDNGMEDYLDFWKREDYLT